MIYTTFIGEYIMTTKTFEEDVTYITRKLQALINSGYLIKDTTNKPIVSAHIAATALAKSTLAMYTLTMPVEHNCLCIKCSTMAMKLIKPYIKNKFIIEQRTSNSHYILVDTSAKEQLQELQDSNDIQIVDILEIEFSKSTLPTYTNVASLYTVSMPPILTPKEVNKVLSLADRLKANQNNYFLLSNAINHTYNTPMTIVRLLGENVISLNALNVAELILTYATNSSALFRTKSDVIKPFVIPYSFFSNEDFALDQTIDEISSSLAELKAMGLINKYNFNSETRTFEILSNVIAKSIKQYTYTQPIGYYKSFHFHQKEYCYTFINYLQYVLNIKYTTTSEPAENVETQTTTKAKQLTICLQALLYNLNLDKYIHDHTYIAKVLNNLRQAGVEAFLLKHTYNEIDTSDVKYLIAHKDKLHEYFILDTEQRMKNIFEEYKELTTLINLDINPAEYRAYCR